MLLRRESPEHDGSVIDGSSTASQIDSAQPDQVDCDATDKRDVAKSGPLQVQHILYSFICLFVCSLVHSIIWIFIHSSIHPVV